MSWSRPHRFIEILLTTDNNEHLANFSGVKLPKTIRAFSLSPQIRRCHKTKRVHSNNVCSLEAVVEKRHPQSGPSSTVSTSNWNLEMLVFVEAGKPEYQKKNHREQGREPTTNSTHTWHQHRESNRATLFGAKALITSSIPASKSGTFFLDKRCARSTWTCAPSFFFF